MKKLNPITLPLFAASLLLFLNYSAKSDSIRLEQLPLDDIHQDFGDPQIDKSIDGHPLSIGGQPFTNDEIITQIVVNAAPVQQPSSSSSSSANLGVSSVPFVCVHCCGCVS